MSGSGAGRYTNLDGSGPPSLGAAFRWGIVDALLGRRRRSPDSAPVPATRPALERIARPPAPGEGANLTWIGHASWLLQLDGRSFLVDPVFGELPGPGSRRNVPPGVAVDQLPSIDAVLVTHNHYDHLDVPSLKRVGAPVIAGSGTKRWLARAGLTVLELGWWQAERRGGVVVTFVPAQHWSRRGVFDVNESLWGGFVVEGSSARVYHAGDTAYFEGFAEIGRRFPELDAALLPIGAYDPAWFMERQHMNPEQAVQAYVDLGAKRFLAMHWGTFKLTDEPLDEPPRRLEAEWRRRGLQDARCTVAVGETVAIGGVQRPADYASV